jgi:hypothetical protein
VKIVGLGIKNALTYLRKEVELKSELRLVGMLNSLECVFGMEFLQASMIEYSVIMLVVYELWRKMFVSGIGVMESISRVHVYRIDMLLFMEWFYCYYLLVVCKYSYVGLLYSLVESFVSMFCESYFI